MAQAAIAAGKIVYGEKPLAATTAEARQIVAAATAADVPIGCAPDTVLGTGIQTARRAVDDGLIGTPVAARQLWTGSQDDRKRSGRANRSRSPSIPTSPAYSGTRTARCPH